MIPTKKAAWYVQCHWIYNLTEPQETFVKQMLLSSFYKPGNEPGEAKCSSQWGGSIQCRESPSKNRLLVWNILSLRCLCESTETRPADNWAHEAEPWVRLEEAFQAEGTANSNTLKQERVSYSCPWANSFFPSGESCIIRLLSYEGTASLIRYLLFLSFFFF